MAASVPKEEVVSLPWDPIWDYMLNDHDLDDMTTQQDDECSSKGFFMREEDESVDWGPKKDAGSRTKARRSVRSERTRSANRSRRFWRRGRQESGITQTSELIEEVELKDDESYDRKGKKGITKWIGGKGTGRNPTEHSNFEEERETTQERVQTPREQELVARDSEQRSPPEQEPPEQEGFFKLGGLLEVWGGSTSEDSEESSQSEETSFEASNASEEISTTTEDISVIDEVSLSLTEVSKSPKQEVNEVRLAFKPFLDESSGSFAAMLDIGSFEKTPNDKQSFLEGNNLGNDINELDGEEDIVDLNNADKFEPASDALGPVTSTKEPEIPVDPIIQSASNETKGGTKKAVSAGTRNQSMRKLRPNRVVCRSITDLSSRQRKIATETGIPIHELSKEDLATYFPKLRTVVDDKAEVIGNCNSFEAFLPAHLQTTLLRRGKPQSLYEYEYETGKHMFVSYSAFGPDARSLIELRPGPELKDNPTGMATALMQVEASTVSQTDCFIRNGFWWRLDSVPLPNIPGVDAIGKLCRIDSSSAKRYNLSVGDRVLTLTKWGGNSRYLFVDPSLLVTVPEALDPSVAVCLAETYLSAFQVLHLGIVTAKRYRKKSLKGKTCLVLGSMDPKMGQAFSEIGKYADVKTIYASAKPKRFDQLESSGIIPLSRDSLEWIDKLEGKVDVIISFEQEVSPLYYSLLSSRGEIVLVCCGEVKVDEALHSPKHSKVFCKRSKWQQRSRTHIYDMYKEWDENNEKCRKDLNHLIDLLGKEVLSPSVLDRIPLGKVAKAQEMIEAKRLSGFLVCEPWLIAKTRALRL